MKSVFENILLIIFLTIFSIILSGYILVQLQITYANEFAANAVERIQASYHNQAVITEIENFQDPEGLITSVDYVANPNDSGYADYQTGVLTVKYQIKMPFIMENGLKGEKIRFVQ